MYKLVLFTKHNYSKFKILLTNTFIKSYYAYKQKIKKIVGNSMEIWILTDIIVSR